MGIIWSILSSNILILVHVNKLQWMIFSFLRFWPSMSRVVFFVDCLFFPSMFFCLCPSIFPGDDHPDSELENFTIPWENVFTSRSFQGLQKPRKTNECPLKINGWFRCISYWMLVPFFRGRIRSFSGGVREEDQVVVVQSKNYPKNGTASEIWGMDQKRGFGKGKSLWILGNHPC